MEPMYLSIQQKETGRQIKRLLSEHGYTVKDVQTVMGFENPQAVYKWISGKSLPSLDNFIILSRLLHTSIEDILVIDGIVAKNGTLLIDYTLTLMDRGHSALEAVIEAGRVRLKPIFMTTITMMVGMTPMALAMTPGSESRVSMAWVIIGGLLTSTVFTLIVIPIIFLLFANHTKKKKQNRVERSAVQFDPFQSPYGCETDSDTGQRTDGHLQEECLQ